MQIKTVTIELGLTLSPRQYESVKVHGAVTVDLSEGDDEEAAFNKARDVVTRHVEGQMVTMISKFGTTNPGQGPKLVK